MAKERRKFEVEDNRQEQHVTGNRSALNIPPGLQLFNNKIEGTVRLEFIPFLVTENHLKYPTDYPKPLRFSAPGKWYYERTYFTHGGVGVDNATVTCAYMTFGKSCPICDVRARLAKSTDKEDNENAYQMRPKERQLFLVIARDERSGELRGDIQLWEEAYWNLGKQLDQYIDGADYDQRAAFKQFYHPERGFTVKLTATKESTGEGKGKYTKFSVHEFRERKEPLPDDLFDHGYDLDAMVRVMDYEALKKVFLGVEEDDKEPAGASRNGDHAERPSRARDTAEEPPARRTQRASRVNDDDDAAPAAKPERKPDPELTPAKPASPAFAKGDWVGLENRGTKLEGVIDNITAENVLRITVEGYDRPFSRDLDDVTLIERKAATQPAPQAAAPARKPDPEPAPAAAGGKPARRGWDDDEDDRSSFRAPAAATKAAPPEDDDPPPARKRK